MSGKKSSSDFPASLRILIIITVFVVIAVFAAIAFKGCSSDEKSKSSAQTADTENSSQSEEDTSETSGGETENTEQTASSNYEYDEERDWALYVIGNNDPLPDDFTIDTKSVAGERLLDERCADYAIAMLEQASSENVGLFVTSSYRSLETQSTNLQNLINSYIASGFSEEEAKEKALTEITAPGCSEHNAGLAMDIVSDDYWSYHDDLEESFDQTPQYEWLIDNAWKYGFMLSYPKGKEDITGIIYEPWHFRFVGLEHAEKIHQVYEETGEFLTLGEYIDNIDQYWQ